MYDAAGEARNANGAASSSTVARRLSGVSRRIRSSEAGSLYTVTPSMMFSTYPGVTALTRMPAPGHSTARARTSWFIPPLPAAYGASEAMPTVPAIDEVIVIEPPRGRAPSTSGRHVGPQ